MNRVNECVIAGHGCTRLPNTRDFIVTGGKRFVIQEKINGAIETGQNFAPVNRFNVLTFRTSQTDLGLPPMDLKIFVWKRRF